MRPDGKVLLSIDQCSIDDIGYYTMEVANRCGRAECSAQLFVELPDYERPQCISPTRPISRMSVTSPTPYDYDDIAESSDTFTPLGVEIEQLRRQDTVRLKWAEVRSRSASYIIEMKTSDLGAWLQLAKGLREAQYQMTVPVPGVEYEFRVRAETSEGTSEASDAIKYHYAGPIPKAYISARPEERMTMVKNWLAQTIHSTADDYEVDKYEMPDRG